MTKALEAEAPIEKLAIDPETVGNMTLALGAAAKNIVPGVTPQEREELDKDLDPRRVKQVRGNDYIPEHDVVRTANRIFGYGRWGTTVVFHECVGEGPMKNSKGEDGYYVGYRCCVRLTVAGCLPVDGVGYGDAFEKQWSGAVTSHELACKEAESDAIKRAFKKFGDQFGLILWAKAEDKKRIAEERAEAEYAKPASDEAIKLVEDQALALNLAEQTAEAIKREVDEHDCVREGWLLKLASRLAEIAKGEQPAAKKDEPKPEPAAAPAPAPAAAEPTGDLLAIAAPDRAATDDEVASLVSLAAMISPEKASAVEAAIVDHRSKIVGGAVSLAWLDKAAKKLNEQLDGNTDEPQPESSSFVPPATATQTATDADVETAFGEAA